MCCLYSIIMKDTVIFFQVVNIYKLNPILQLPQYLAS